MHDPQIEPGTDSGVNTQVDLASVSSVVQEVWSSMLGVDLANGGDWTATGYEEHPLQGSIQIVGAWQGAVVLSCSPEYARAMAAGMFGAEPDTLSAADVNDALGELVNVIGGNLKQLLPSPCHLSLPAVREVESPPSPASAGLVANVGFVCEKDAFHVSVVENGGEEKNHASSNCG
jgi:chemotaxis protein CheX